MSNIDDNRIVMSLDAGEPNVLFSAVSKGKRFVSSVILALKADLLNQCVKTIIKGFSLIGEQLSLKPDNIRFAFYGSAEYPNVIIGDYSFAKNQLAKNNNNQLNKFKISNAIY